MFCIQQIETHRDRMTEAIFGPYVTWEEAMTESHRLYNHPRNITQGGNHYYDFMIFNMEQPQFYFPEE